MLYTDLSIYKKKNPEKKVSWFPQNIKPQKLFSTFIIIRTIIINCPQFFW